MSFSSLLMGGRYAAMTSYFNVAFFAGFLPLSVIGYSVVPKAWKKYFLLLASYVFFWLVSGKLVVYLALSTLSIHYFGLWLDRLAGQRHEQVKAAQREERKAIKAAFLRRQRGVLTLAVVLHIGVLLTLKYTPFFTQNLNTLLRKLPGSLSLEIPSYLLPIGISFFTLQAVSYLVDVYRGVIKADDNLLRLALFMSFFPQIVEGPICRYGDTAQALWEVAPIRFENLKLGLQRILYGFMKKVVVADRLNPFVGEVFSHYTSYEGGMIALAAVGYTVQLYMDFSGTMDVVVGIARIFGVTMPENFQRPFFSKTVSEFWQRWHITLGTWFRDYIFYPVTMSKRMKSLTSCARKKLGNHFGPLAAGAIALFCVWFCNGLWHGAAWHYLFFGMYHFVLILGGSLIEPLVKRVNRACHIKSEWGVYRAVQIVRTSLLVVIGELFFRANGLRAGFAMFRKMVTDFRFTTCTAALFEKLGLDPKDLLIVGVTLLLVLVASVLSEKGIGIRKTMKKQNVVLRWAFWYLVILFIILFGAYGRGCVPVEPMYANF